MAASLMVVLIVAIMSVLPSSRRTAEDHASVLPMTEILDTASSEKIESEILRQNKDDEHAVSESDIQSESDIIGDSVSRVREKRIFSNSRHIPFGIRSRQLYKKSQTRFM